MRLGVLKKIRVGISLVFLIILFAVFLDFGNHFATGVINGFTWPQFIPSLLKFMTVAGIATSGFILITIITLLFGRVYCSTVCPLGIMQDIFSRLFRKRGKGKKRKKPFKFTKPQNKLRFGILVMTIITFISGSIFLINLLDPFSIFGRLINNLARPVYFGANNVLSGILKEFDIFSVASIEFKGISLVSFGMSLAFLALIGWFSVRRGRLYCNTVCPVGALFGLLSRVSLFRLAIKESRCTSCGLCLFNCKAECIDVKHKEIDFSRCVSCYNCITSCPSNGIYFKNALKPAKDPVFETPVDRTKRKLFTGTSALILGVTSGLFAQKNIKNEKPTTVPTDREYPVSPPGAGALDHFNNTCTGCQLCVTECPTQVLQPAMFEYGIWGIMQPVMDYHASFCNYECNICTLICPSGALLPLKLEEKKFTQLGVAEFIKDNCVVHTDNTACGACAEHCPTKAVHMVPYKEGDGKLKIPEVDDKICVGCGACEYACPTTPYKAIYVNGNAQHVKAEKPKQEKLDNEVDYKEEFPF